MTKGLKQSSRHTNPRRESDSQITDIEAIACVSDEQPDGSVLVRVRTTSGFVGIGECFGPGPNRAALNALKALVDGPIRNTLVGQPAMEISRLWADLYRIGGRMYYRRGLFIHAMSGIDIALHDVVGKILNVPVYQLLGGRSERQVRVYASCVFIDPSDLKPTLKDVTHFVRSGFGGVKFYGWPGFGENRKRDIGVLKELRRSAGDNIDLMLDLGRARGMADARKMLAIIEDSEVGIAWWEEPFNSPDALENLVALSRLARIPITGGEAEITAFAFKDLLRQQAVSIVQPDLALVGGLTEGRRVAEFARIHGVPIAPHNWGTMVNVAAGLHLLTSIPNGHACEYPITGRLPMPGNGRKPSPMFTKLVKHEVKIEKGFATLPDRPGLGIEIDEEMLQKFSAK